MIGSKEDRDASRPESEVTTNGIIRMDRLFQAFPPQRTARASFLAYGSSGEEE